MSEPARAIVHDQFRVMGGAERVACAMARLLDCPIYAGRVDDGVVPADVDVREVFDGRVGRRAMRSHYMVQDAYQMLAWQQQPALREYDTLVVNKTNPLWYVPQEHQTVVAYIHSTPRGLYDQFARSEYGIAKRGLKMWMRTLFETNRCTPDALACNSELVKRRIGLHWGRDDVACIHPPVDTDAFGQDAARGDGDYLFTVSRLHDHKRRAAPPSSASATATRSIKSATVRTACCTTAASTTWLPPSSGSTARAWRWTTRRWSSTPTNLAPRGSASGSMSGCGSSSVRPAWT